MYYFQFVLQVHIVAAQSFNLAVQVNHTVNRLDIQFGYINIAPTDFTLYQPCSLGVSNRHSLRLPRFSDEDQPAPTTPHTGTCSRVNAMLLNLYFYMPALNSFCPMAPIDFCQAGRYTAREKASARH